MSTPGEAGALAIHTPGQRLRVYVSSASRELAAERLAAREAIRRLRLSPVMFELGAKSYPPRELYRAYLEESHIFVGIYWQSYGFTAPEGNIPELEEEYLLSGEKPKLIYVKTPAPQREPGLTALLERIQDDDRASYKPFATAAELGELLENDLALVLTEGYETARLGPPERPVQLPVPPTPLVGREREVAEARALLLREEVRLLTLSGPGGIGKSRLALELAHGLKEHFRDGVFFVPLAPIREPELVLGTIAQTLKLKVTGPSALEALKSFLRDKQVLLLLDNFEQVVAAAPLVAEFLASAPQLKALVTSRELLHMSAEHVYPVPPLSLVHGERSPLEAVSESEAVRLFVTRAQAVKPGFALNSENASVVAEICRRLDGLPLAIELAAARVKLLSPQALLDRLRNKLVTLGGGARDLPTRQQTLKNTIDWSYGLLTEGEKALFVRLGVFVGGCSLEAAEALCQGDNVLEELVSLADKSLINISQQDEGEPRFFMLETLRAYALEKLEESGQLETWRRCHADYFTAYAQRVAPHLKGPEQQLYVKRLERDHDHIRAVMSWALEGKIEVVARISWALWVMWWVSAHTSEGHRWLQEAVALWRPRSLALSKEHQAKLLGAAGIMAFWQGAHELVPPLIGECIPLFQELGDKGGEAYALLALGASLTSQGEYDRAHEVLERSIPLFRAAQDAWGGVLAANGLGRNAVRQREYSRARAIFEESLRLTRQSGDPLALTVALNALATISLRQKDAAHAISLLNESLTISQRLGYLEGIAWSLEGQAIAAALQGQALRSVRLIGAAEALRETIEFPAWTDTTAYMAEVKGTLQATLDEASFAAAWAEGRAMGPLQAVAYALEEMTTT